MAKEFKPSAVGKKKKKMPVHEVLQKEKERTTLFSKSRMTKGDIKFKSY